MIVSRSIFTQRFIVLLIVNLFGLFFIVFEGHRNPSKVSQSPTPEEEAEQLWETYGFFSELHLPLELNAVFSTICSVETRSKWFLISNSMTGPLTSLVDTRYQRFRSHPDPAFFGPPTPERNANWTQLCGRKWKAQGRLELFPPNKP